MINNFSLALIGCGKWGINHLKTANKLFGENFKMVCDFNSETKKIVKEFATRAKFTTNLQDILNNNEINSCIVATPAVTHFEISKQLLLKNKNLLVEKPITLKSTDAKELNKIAVENNLTLMTGHILLYHPAIVKLKNLISEGIIGELQYIYSNRLNLGTIRTEENVLWSFAPHDIALIQFLTESYPTQIFAKGTSFINKSVEDSTLTILTYPNNIHAHIFVSWLHPFKEHRLVVIGSKGMLVFEDSLKENKLKFYSKGFNISNIGLPEKFEEPEKIISFESSNTPLEIEQLDFANSVQNNKLPIANSKHAIEVLQILEEAERSMRSEKK